MIAATVGVVHLQALLAAATMTTLLPTVTVRSRCLQPLVRRR